MLARQIPKGTHLHIESDLPKERIRCLERPSRPADPPMAGENLWRLVSHLTLNKLSLGDLEGLKRILFLYSGSDENSRKRRQIEGIYSLKTKPVVRRLGDRRWRGFVRGTEIQLRLKEENFVGGSAYLFGAVLDRFFALYAGVNSFTELVIFREQDQEEWKRWPARVGDRPLL
jgi:type VI secretion system protein ImpG